MTFNTEWDADFFMVEYNPSVSKKFFLVKYIGLMKSAQKPFSGIKKYIFGKATKLVDGTFLTPYCLNHEGHSLGILAIVKSEQNELIRISKFILSENNKIMTEESIDFIGEPKSYSDVYIRTTENTYQEIIDSIE